MKHQGGLIKVLKTSCSRLSSEPNSTFPRAYLHVDVIHGAADVLEDRLEGHVEVTRQETVLHPAAGKISRTVPFWSLGIRIKEQR